MAYAMAWGMAWAMAWFGIRALASWQTGREAMNGSKYIYKYELKGLRPLPPTRTLT